MIAQRQPRVLFLDHVAEIGGAERLLLDIARRLRERAEVQLFTDGPLRELLERAGVPVSVAEAGAGLLGVRRTTGFFRALSSIPGVARLVRSVALRARAFDVLFANSQKALIVGAIAARLARLPLVWYLHDLLTAHHFGTVNRATSARFANTFAARVVANSHATADAFAAAGGRRGKVEVVYNGIDPAPFDAADPLKAGAALRRELNCGSGARLLGSFSRLAPWKGQHVLVEALAAMPGDVHAVFVGEALFGEHDYNAELRHRVRASAIADRVHFLGFRDDVPVLMKAVDIVIHTSVAPEPFGRVIVEGMLATKPVIATAAGGALEIVEDGTNGRLVPPADATALARTIEALLANPCHATALGQKGRADVVQRFSLDACVAAIKGILEQVCHRTF